MRRILKCLHCLPVQHENLLLIQSYSDLTFACSVWLPMKFCEMLYHRVPLMQQCSRHTTIVQVGKVRYAGLWAFRALSAVIGIMASCLQVVQRGGFPLRIRSLGVL